MIRMEIGGCRFRSKKQATDEIRKIVANAELGEPLDAGIHRFLEGLLAKHESPQDVVGPGVSYFMVKENCVHGGKSRGFWVKRIDNTEIHFSWVKCLTRKSKRQQVWNAMRAAIQPDMYRFRDKYFRMMETEFKTLQTSVICPLSGKELTRKTAVTHHSPPFEYLVREFIGHALTDEQALQWYEVVRINEGKYFKRLGDHLADDALRKRWVNFHRLHAQLHLVDRETHSKCDYHSLHDIYPGKIFRLKPGTTVLDEGFEGNLVKESYKFLNLSNEVFNNHEIERLEDYESKQHQAVT